MKNKNSFKNLQFFETVFLIVFLSFHPVISQDIELPVKYFSYIGHNNLSAVVANVGKLDITAEEFLLSYEFGPSFLKHKSDSKMRYLNVMINEKLLALEGYAKKLDSSSQVRRTLREVEGDIITEELFKDDVLTKVFVSEEEIREGIKKDQQHLALKWLFSKSMADIYRQKKMLDEGVPFDTLFSRQINDSVSVDNRYLETTRFKLSNNNPLLSHIVDTLKTDNYSAPIKVNDGWHIIKVVDGWSNAIMTESEWMKKRHDLKRIIRKNKSDKLSDLYVKKMMAEQNPTIIRNTFNILQAYIGKNVLQPKKYTEWDLAGQIKLKSGTFTLSNIESYRNLKLVKYKSGIVLLQDFIDWYDIRKNYINFNSVSRQSFFISLRQTIWQMLRDKLLIMRAYERGLQNREIVKKQMKWWKDKVVYSTVKAEMSGVIEITDKQLLAHYKKYKHTFKNSKGKIIPFNKAKNNVRSDLQRQLYMIAMYRRILKLRQKYNITIHEEVLNNIYVEVENEPKAIEVYTVKTGGTLPRAAYPTIDWDWRAWY